MIEVENDYQQNSFQYKKGKLRPEFMDSPMLLGKEIEILLPNKEKRRGQFAVVELDNIIASHNEDTFSSSKGYPVDEEGNNVNDRNYQDDPNAQGKVLEVAQNLEPSILVTTSRTPAGTPIISTDGFVVSGNNRTMSLKLALKNYPEKYEEYKKLLVEEAEAFGIPNSTMTAIVIGDRIVDELKAGKLFNERTEEDYIKIDHPVLVRFDYDFPAYNTLELSKYNKDTKKSERPIDKAIKLSHILNDNERLRDAISHIVGEYETLSDFYSNLKDQKRLMEILTEGNILTNQEIASYYTETGFNASGKDLIEMILASIVLKKEALTASEMTGVKRFRNIVITSLPVLVKNASLTEGSLIEPLNEAIVLELEIYASGLSFKDYISQSNLFKELPERNVFILNRLLDSGRNNFKKSMEAYNASVLENQGESLFGTKPSLEEIFKVHISSKIDPKELNLIDQFSAKEKQTNAKIELYDYVEFKDEENKETRGYIGEVLPNGNLIIEGEFLTIEKPASEIKLLEKHSTYKEKYGYDFDDIDRLYNGGYFEEGLIEVDDVKHYVTHQDQSQAGKRAMFAMGEALLKEFEANYNGRWSEDQNHFLINVPLTEEVLKEMKLICRLKEQGYDDCVMLKAIMYEGDYQKENKDNLPFFEDHTSELFLQEVSKFKTLSEFKRKYEELREWIDIKDKAKLGVIRIEDTNWYPTKTYVDYSKNSDDFPFFQKLIDYVKSGKGIPPIIAERSIFNDGRKGYTVRDGIHRLSAYDHNDMEFIPAIVYETSINTLTRDFDNPYNIGIEEFLGIKLEELYRQAQLLHDSQGGNDNAKAGRYKSYDHVVENVLLPAKVREPFVSNFLSELTRRELIKDKKFKYLHDLKEADLPTVSSEVMYELMQLTHPTDYKVGISRMALIEEWNQRGEKIFKDLGLPTDYDYPYVNKHMGYLSVDRLEDALGGEYDYYNWWWSVAEHSLPVADMQKALEIIEEEKRKWEALREPLLNPKTGKAMGKSKEQVNTIEYKIKSLNESKKVIEDYIKKSRKEKHPDKKDLDLKEKNAKAQKQRLRLLKKKLELQNKKK